MMATDASTYLTDQEVKEIDNVMTRAPDVDLTFMQAFASKQLVNSDAESGEYYVADDDEGSARLLRSLSEAPGIFVAGQKVTYSVYMAGAKFSLKQSDIDMSRALGRSLDTEHVERAKRAVDVKLNKLAYIGDTDFGVPGVLEASGVTSISGTAVSGSSTVASDFIGYFNSLPIQFRSRYPYTLVLPDAIWKLLRKIGNTYNDKSLMTQITDAIPNLTIVSEANLLAGTALSGGTTVGLGDALLIPRSADAVRLPFGRAPTPKMQLYNDVGEIKATVHARMGPPELVFPTAVGKITGLA